jgi:DNA-binding transcriptional ArsR family regulator
MDADPRVSAVAALLSDASRATVLWALSDGTARPACELALRAGVTKSTISFHLARLVDGRLLQVERQGRHHYYRLASPAVAAVLETLAAVAPPAAARTFQEGRAGQAIRYARTCYDHLAGVVGVALTESLLRRRALRARGGDYELTPTGERLLSRLGADIAGARRARRAFARPCLDWSERKHHLAGALGTALLERLLALQWIRRSATGRAVLVTPAGRERLRRTFGVRLAGA